MKILFVLLFYPLLIGSDRPYPEDNYYIVYPVQSPVYVPKSANSNPGGYYYSWEVAIGFGNYWNRIDLQFECPFCGNPDYIKGSACPLCGYERGVGTSNLYVGEGLTLLLLCSSIYAVFIRFRKRNGRM